MHDPADDTLPRTTHALQMHHLERLAQAMREAGQPATLFRAVEAVASEAIGFRLFTIMAFDARTHEVVRLFSNMPQIYPAGGRKTKRGTAWATRVLHELRPFRGETVSDLREAFDDHRVLTGMNLGSILNIPIAYDGACVGTMNLTHAEHWYAREHEQVGVLIGSFLAPALLSMLPALTSDAALDINGDAQS